MRISTVLAAQWIRPFNQRIQPLSSAPSWMAWVLMSSSRSSSTAAASSTACHKVKDGSGGVLAVGNLTPRTGQLSKVFFLFPMRMALGTFVDRAL